MFVRLKPLKRKNNPLEFTILLNTNTIVKIVEYAEVKVAEGYGDERLCAGKIVFGLGVDSSDYYLDQNDLALVIETIEKEVGLR